ncbi:MAG: hypothetical protein H6Q41_5274, partial [Deltaproteobacteria bacterium]|nr:hypothetical protein [Deltaproteobacteria bacterium]
MMTYGVTAFQISAIVISGGAT